MRNKVVDDKVLKDLLDVTYTIKLVYDKLMEAEVINSKFQYQQALEELNMCLELENKIYNQIPNQVEFKDTILNRLNCLNDRRETSFYLKDIVMSRIYNFISMRDNLNPFLSMEESSIVKIAENKLSIYVQFYLDYIHSYIYSLNKYIMEMSTSFVKAILTVTKYEGIFSFKLNEQLLLKQQFDNKLIIDGRERCLIFNQIPSLVKNFYHDEVLDLINLSIQDFFKERVISKSLSEQEDILYLLKIKVESVLNLLDNEEREAMFSELFKENILGTETLEINDLILDIFYKLKKENQIKNKKLVCS